MHHKGCALLSATYIVNVMVHGDPSRCQRLSKSDDHRICLRLPSQNIHANLYMLLKKQQLQMQDSRNFQTNALNIQWLYVDLSGPLSGFHLIIITVVLLWLSWPWEIVFLLSTQSYPGIIMLKMLS